MAGQDFICSCLLSRLPASIYSSRNFFFFFFFLNALVWLCASFPLLSVLLLCSAGAFPGCISSFIWEGVLLVGRMLALQFVISPFPPILLHHSNPLILSSLVQPCSVPWFFWGLPLHLVPEASFSSGIPACGCSVEWRALAFWGTGLQEECAACSSCLSLNSRLLLSCLEADSCCFGRQLLPAPPRLLLAPWAWHGTVWGLPNLDLHFPLEFFSRIPEIFPHLLGSVSPCGHGDEPTLVLIRGKRKSTAASYFLVLMHRACLHRLVFLNKAGESSRKPFFSRIQGRFFLPALNTHVELSVTFTVGVSLDVLDFLLLSWCSSLMFLALDCACSLPFPPVCVFSPSADTKPDILCLCSVCVQPQGIFFLSVCVQCWGL